MGDTDTSQPAGLLAGMDELRHRVRRERRQHPLWAALVGVVALAGTASFWLTDQLETRVCEQVTIGTSQFLQCVGTRQGFGAAWVWIVAAVVAAAVPFVKRYRRGSWRPSTNTLIALSVATLIVLPAVLSLSPVIAPIAFPVAAAAAVSGIATSRRDVFSAAMGVALAVAMLYVHLRIDPEWLLERNLGFTLFSLAAAALALLAAAVWRRTDQRL